jgi:serine/threonine-protein phosphatase 6 regulatory ankyrin repeat subunit B
MRALALVILAAMACGGAYAQSDDLVSAAKRGDAAAVRSLLQAGADANQRDFISLGGNIGDATALMAASFQGSLEAVQALLAAKADVNATMSEKKDGETALTFAVWKGHVEVARALLAANANVDHETSGESPLYAAARSANLNMVKVLLTAKPKLNRQGRGGQTALMYAISTGRRDSPEMARLLIEAGADVNLQTNTGISALMVAVQRDLATVQRLLAAGAGVDFKFCTVASVRRTEGVLVLSWDRFNSTALAIASSLGNVDIVRALLAAKADVNLAQCDGKTPLTLATENGHAEVAELLRAAGAVLQR